MRRPTLPQGAQDTQERAAATRGHPPSHDSASTWEIDGLKVQYIRVQPERFWGIEDVWVDESSRVPITDRERTVLDGFVAPDVFGSLHEIVGALEEHLLEIDMPRLVEYALRYGQGAAIKRLGYVLEQFGVDETVLRPLQEAPIRGYRLLDPQGQVQGPHIARWHIRDNVAA
jgi:predicted transcriptional regulator of viral defense system